MKEILIPHLSDTQADIFYFDHCVNQGSQQFFLKPKWSPELWLNVDILFGAIYHVAFLKQLATQDQDKLFARAVHQAKSIEHVPNLLLQTTVFPWQDLRLAQQHRQTVQDYLDLLGVPLPEISFRVNGSLRFHWKPSLRLV
ncbi:MAG: hypothetical protein ACPL1K_06730, partial [Candidatus Kryptoniota bacterium]